MNERIKEILTQCQQESIDGPEYPHWTDLEKFAELIVRQFDRILVNEYLDCVGENDTKSQVRIDRLRERVKEYFGVE